MKQLLSILFTLTFCTASCHAQYGTSREHALTRLFSKDKKNEYVPGHAFENGGYDLRDYYALFYMTECRLVKFAECDTLAYIKMRSKDMKENEFYFMFLSVDEATTVLDSVMVKSKERKKRARVYWFQQFIKNTGMSLKVTDSYSFKVKFDDDRYWTFFKAKKVANGRAHTSLDYFKYEDFTLKKAVTAYLYQRGYDEKGEKRKNLTGEDWMSFFKVVKVVLPHVGGDMDGRPLYDQITDPNRTR